MREIKYKAWNDIDKVMIDWSTLRANPSLFMGIATGKVKHHKLLQYTGLKDKNGVEIYEGDVVDCWDACGFENIAQSLCGSVVFNGGCFCVLDKGGYHNKLALTCAENVEVIGNVYQNPELVDQ